LAAEHFKQHLAEYGGRECWITALLYLRECVHRPVPVWNVPFTSVVLKHCWDAHRVANVRVLEIAEDVLLPLVEDGDDMPAKASGVPACGVARIVFPFLEPKAINGWA
jgi:hypothetical protein